MSIIPPLPRPQIPSELDRRIKVWVKAAVIPGWDYTEWRRDAYGNVIRYDDYNNRDSEYGWEIDHIVPRAKGGSGHIDNLQPLHWKANLAKSDKLTPQILRAPLPRQK